MWLGCEAGCSTEQRQATTNKFSLFSIDEVGERTQVGQILVSLNIPAHRYLSSYEGTAKDVVTTALDARTVRFPARVLPPYLTHYGIVGTFMIMFDDHHKFVSIDKPEHPSTPG